MAEHVLQLPELNGISCNKLFGHDLQNIDNIILGVLSLHAWTFLIDHVEHLILNELIYQLFNLPLLLQEVVILPIVLLADDDVGPCQLFHQQVSLIESLN